MSTLFGKEVVMRNPARMLLEMGPKRIGYAKLSRPLLVRVSLAGNVPVLVESLELCESGIRFYSPCKLDLTCGQVLGMELFMHPEAPLPVIGRVAEVRKFREERYGIEVRFEKLSKWAEDEITDFIDGKVLS
ncbi:MAG: hypothetical protein ACYC2Y_04895 [Armatimonadota bacterium]